MNRPGKDKRWSAKACGEAGERDHARDVGLEHSVNSGNGVQRSKSGSILKEELQDLLVSFRVCEKEESGLLSSSLPEQQDNWSKASFMTTIGQQIKFG